VIVADASLVTASLIRHGPARELMMAQLLHAPHLIDFEVASAVRRHVRVGDFDARTGWDLLRTFRWLAITRHGTFSMLDRVWELRDNLTAYDAAYVALAEIIDCPLATADARISRAPGLRCSVTVVPG
jgi:predicted nucleic acid-binding protein